MNRNLKIDQMKGLCAILVIYGHVLINSSLYGADALTNEMAHYIYSFHVPVFMFLSGYNFYYVLSKGKEFKLVKRVVSLLWPAIVFSAFEYLPGAIKKGDLVGGVTQMLINGKWFLFALALFTLIYGLIFFIVKADSFRAMLGIMVFVLFVIGYMRMPALRVGVIYYPFFAVGLFYHVYKGNDWIKTIHDVVQKVGVIMFPYLLLVYNAVGKKEVSIYFWLAGFSGLMFIDFIFTYANLSMRLGEFLALCGRFSLQLYCLPTFITKILNPLYISLGIQVNEGIYTFIVAIILTAIITVASLVLSILIDKSKVLSLFLFGKVPKQ